MVKIAEEICEETFNLHSFTHSSIQLRQTLDDWNTLEKKVELSLSVYSNHILFIIWKKIQTFEVRGKTTMNVIFHRMNIYLEIMVHMIIFLSIWKSYFRA
jgi:hypothetical protein